MAKQWLEYVLINFNFNFFFLPQVNLNGVLSFKEKFNIPHPQPFPYKSLAMISPYWGNYDTSRNGDVYYRTTKDSTLLKRAQYHLQSIFTSARDFSPSYLVIVTWDRVSELGLAGNPRLVSIAFSCFRISRICLKYSVVKRRRGK